MLYASLNRSTFDQIWSKFSHFWNFVALSRCEIFYNFFAKNHFFQFSDFSDFRFPQKQEGMNPRCQLFHDFWKFDFSSFWKKKNYFHQKVDPKLLRPYTTFPIANYYLPPTRNFFFQKVFKNWSKIEKKLKKKSLGVFWTIVIFGSIFDVKNDEKFSKILKKKNFCKKCN